MKILDNKKDYYDYLMGVFGQDEKIVYDRRNSINYDMFLKNNLNLKDNISKMAKFILRLNNKHFVFLKDGDWYLPEEIAVGFWWKKSYVKNGTETTLKELNSSKNFFMRSYGWEKHSDTPISLMLEIPSEKPIFIDNPILQSFQPIAKFISPETVYNEIHDFIASKYDKEIVDTRTDVEKAEAAGFDKKTSFRKM